MSMKIPVTPSGIEPAIQTGYPPNMKEAHYGCKNPTTVLGKRFKKDDPRSRSMQVVYCLVLFKE